MRRNEHMCKNGPEGMPLSKRYKGRGGVGY